VLDDEADNEPGPDVSPEALEPQVGPEDLEPSIEPPTVSADDAPAELQENFWKLVAVLNLALFAIALGPMLIFFRGQWQAGGGVTLVGAVALVVAVRRYRATKRRLQNGSLE
jgi:hypothetical protein